MDWQESASLIIVGATALLMIGTRLRRRLSRHRPLCPSGCDCPARIPSDTRA